MRENIADLNRYETVEQKRDYGAEIRAIVAHVQEPVFKRRLERIANTESLIKFVNNVIPEIKAVSIGGKATGLTTQEARETNTYADASWGPVIGEHRLDTSLISPEIEKLFPGARTYLEIQQLQDQRASGCNNPILKTIYQNLTFGIGGYAYHKDMGRPTSEASIIRVPLLKDLDSSNGPIGSGYDIIDLTWKVPDGFLENGEHVHAGRGATNHIEFVTKRESRLGALLSSLYINKPQNIYDTLNALQLAAAVTPYREDLNSGGLKNSKPTQTRGYVDSPVGASFSGTFNLTMFDYTVRSVKGPGDDYTIKDDKIELAQLDFRAAVDDETKISRTITDLREAAKISDEEYWNKKRSILYNLELYKS